MALSKDDKMPVGITYTEAYEKIKKWYQDNLHRLDDSTEYRRQSILFIQSLPDVSDVDKAGIKTIFNEVINGKLEWAYHESDGEFKMAAYAIQALEDPFF